MQSLSDLIEEFILNTIGSDETLNLSRNELANFFNVSPSQINYVLSTRFTLDRGFLTESKRGGGGYIVLKKVVSDDLISSILKNLDKNLEYSQALYILENLYNNNIISLSEVDLIKSCISPRALSSPFKIENTIRYNIFKNLLINLQSRGK